MSSQNRDDTQVHHIGQYGGLQAGSVGIYKKETGVPGQQLGAQLYKREYALLDFPDFPFGASSVGGRIHNYAVISVPSADFTFHEFDTIVYQPADGSI